jgi:transposase
MHRHALTNEQWEVVLAVIPQGPGRPSELGDRNFINAVVWMAKTGAPWRDLPERFGPWKTIYNRFSYWAKRGVWEVMFKALAFTDDEIGSLLDGSVVRAHQDSAGGAGGPKKTL